MTDVRGDKTWIKIDKIAQEKTSRTGEKKMDRAMLRMYACLLWYVLVLLFWPLGRIEPSCLCTNPPLPHSLKWGRHSSGSSLSHSPSKLALLIEVRVQ